MLQEDFRAALCCIGSAGTAVFTIVFGLTAVLQGSVPAGIGCVVLALATAALLYGMTRAIKRVNAYVTALNDQLRQELEEAHSLALTKLAGASPELRAKVSVKLAEAGNYLADPVAHPRFGYEKPPAEWKADGLKLVAEAKELINSYEPNKA